MQQVLEHRADLRAINRKWNLQVGTTLGIWALISLTMGLVMGVGSVPGFGAWLFAFEVAALLSPIVIIVLTAFSRKARAARMQLAMLQSQAPALTGLTAGLLKFAEQTRVVRLALADSDNHDEAMRHLYGWLESLDSLEPEDAELAGAHAVGPGPVGQLLRGASEKTPDLSDEDIARAVAHLQHVEGQLGVDSKGDVYR